MPVLDGEKHKMIQGKSFTFRVVKERAFSLLVYLVPVKLDEGELNLYTIKDKPNIFYGRKFYGEI